MISLGKLTTRNMFYINYLNSSTTTQFALRVGFFGSRVI
jgi:hypothetical protein